jgi:RNA polymerase sigma factor (sigma-70 family)
VRRLLNERRSRTRRDAAVARLAAREGDDRDSQGADAVIEDDLTDLVMALPPRQRVALALRYYDDLAPSEIAEIMGITEGAVRYHLHEARVRLRDALGDLDE